MPSLIAIFRIRIFALGLFWECEIEFRGYIGGVDYILGDGVIGNNCKTRFLKRGAKGGREGGFVICSEVKADGVYRNH